MPDFLSDAISWFTSAISKGADVLGITSGQIAESFVSWITAGIAELFEVAFEPIFRLMSSPISFDFAGDVTLAFQGVALSIAFIVIMGRGITKGIVGSATDDDMDIVRYVWRSILPIGAIIVAPTAASLITSAAADVMGYVAGAGTLESFAHNLSVLVFNLVGNNNTVSEGNAVAKVLGAFPALLFALISALAIFWNVFALTLEVMKRWVQLAMLSVIVPFAAVTTTIEDAGDAIACIKTMVGIVVTILLQILLLVSASGVVAAQESIGLVETVFLFVAILVSARSLPAWIDKFTYASPIGGGHTGSRAIVFASKLFTRRRA